MKCKTPAPRHEGRAFRVVLPGGDLLSRGLHRTIIGAALFHGPVRDGKAWFRRAMATRQFGGRGRGACRQGQAFPAARRVWIEVCVGGDRWRDASFSLRRARERTRAGGLGQGVVCGFAQDACGYRIKPHGQLVLVSSRHYCPSTPSLSTGWSVPTLQRDQVTGRFHLGARFPLRCFQRLSLPYIATRRCDWRHNRYTSGTSTPVLSY